MVRPDKMGTRESVVRSLIYKRYKTAYKISSEHALSAGPSLQKQSGFPVDSNHFFKFS